MVERASGTDRTGGRTCGLARPIGSTWWFAGVAKNTPTAVAFVARDDAAGEVVAATATTDWWL
jgi:hypothetical protein